jgi:hypothetical protein
MRLILRFGLLNSIPKATPEEKVKINLKMRFTNQKERLNM